MVDCFIIKKTDMKNIILPILLLMLVLVSCNQDVEGPLIPGADLDNVYFPEKELEGIEVSEGSSIVVCPIARYLKEDAGTTVKVEMVLAPEDEGLFQLVNSDFVFAQGELEKNVEISVTDLSLLDPFKAYSITLNLVGENALVFNSMAKLQVAKKRIFTSLGKGTVTSEIFGGAWQVDVDGLIGESQAIYKVDMYGDGYFVEIYVSDTDIEVAGQPAWISGTYGDVYVSGEGSVEGKELQMNLLHYLPGLGSFGTFKEVLTLP